MIFTPSIGTLLHKYKKDFYVDNDLKPTEQLFFSLTIIPLGAYETTNVISK